MKIRQGFVSNSSTSSFILIGRKATEEEIKSEYEKCNGFDEEILSNEDFYEMCEFLGNFHCVGDDFYKGNLLADWSDDYSLQSKNLDLTSLINEVKDIENPKLFYGTYAS